MNKTMVMCRKELGLTQKQVADMVGITERMYQHIESGRRTGSLLTLLRLGKVYNKSVEYLMQESIDRVGLERNHSTMQDEESKGD